MLVRDPDERITMGQIHQHPWFIANLPMEVRWCITLKRSRPRELFKLNCKSKLNCKEGGGRRGHG
jgi:hypothetical protein